MLSSPTPTHTIRETVATLGAQRGRTRYYAQGSYLHRAGFTPQRYLTVTTTDTSVVLEPSDAPTTHRVSAKQQGRVPVIDLTGVLLDALGGEGTACHVTVALGRITLTPAAVQQRIAARPRDRTTGSLFTGGGLLDYAATQAGFTTRFGVEIAEPYADVFAANHPDATTYHMSVHEAAALPLPSVELLCIGLPCEPWSQARRTDRGTAAKRDAALPATAHEHGDLILWAFACTLRINPRTLVLESAPAFAKSEVCYAFAGALRRIGYHVYWDVINATWYGGFTQRKRTVLVARTDAIDAEWPDHAPRTEPVASILEAPDSPDVAWFDAASKPWVFAHAAKQRAKGNGFSATIVPPDATTTPVIKKRYHAGQGDNPMLAHPTEPDTYRWFTVPETARLMGLPATYHLPDAKTTAGEVIGQGVDVTAFTRILNHVTRSN